MQQSTYTNELPPMMSPEQAADALNVSVSTIRNWIKDGTLPAYRLGPRFVRVMVSDLKALISELGNLDAIELEA